MSQTFTTLGKVRAGCKGLPERAQFLWQAYVQTFYFLAENSPVFLEEIVFGDPGKHIRRFLPN